MYARCGLQTVLGEFPDQILVAAHHVRNDPYQISWTVSRGSWYGIAGTPTVYFDGVLEAEGAYQNCSQMASWYRSLINSRLNSTGGVSPVGISGYFAPNGTTITASATFEKLDPVTLTNTKAFILLLEDHISYGGQEYNHTTRAAYEQVVTLTNVGDQVEVTTDFTVSGAWNPDNLVAVAWLQNMTSKEIYQSAPLSLGGAAVDEPPVAAFESGVTGITPNPFVPLGPGAGSTTIRLQISDRSPNPRARLDVVDPSGRLVRNLLDGWLTAGQHAQSWDGRDATGTPVGAGIYYVRFSDDRERNLARLVLVR